MAYKILVMDLDGTLTNSDKIITPKTKDALFELQEQGVLVVLASGRPTHGVVPLAEELKLAHYGGFILSYNGAHIMNCKTGEVIYQRTVPSELIPELVRLSQKYNVDILSYEGKNLICNNKENPYALKESFINKMPVIQVDDMAGHIEFPVNKMMMLADGDYLAKVEERVREDMHHMLAVYRSEVYFLELMPKDIDKAHSLGKLLEHLGMEREEMIACGDGFNDISMVEYAGLGVAMQNAQDAVKEVANYITRSNDEDGIAHVIHKFFTFDKAESGR